jgi:hypothetical protein
MRVSRAPAGIYLAVVPGLTSARQNIAQAQQTNNPSQRNALIHAPSRIELGQHRNCTLRH